MQENVRKSKKMDLCIKDGKWTSSGLLVAILEPFCYYVIMIYEHNPIGTEAKVCVTKS